MVNGEILGRDCGYLWGKRERLGRDLENTWERWGDTWNRDGGDEIEKRNLLTWRCLICSAICSICGWSSGSSFRTRVSISFSSCSMTSSCFWIFFTRASSSRSTFWRASLSATKFSSTPSKRSDLCLAVRAQSGNEIDKNQWLSWEGVKWGGHGNGKWGTKGHKRRGDVEER